MKLKIHKKEVLEALENYFNIENIKFKYYTSEDIGEFCDKFDYIKCEEKCESERKCPRNCPLCARKD